MENETLVKVLSVDWDYFFPAIDHFDWGHSEDRLTSFYLEVAWTLRACHKLESEVLFGKEHIENLDQTIYEYLQPAECLNSFWTRAIEFPPIKAVATESHSDIYELFKNTKFKLVIDNFDAHHDGGYNGDNEKVNCGNWAEMLKKRGVLKEYNVYYPHYRSNIPEGGSKPKWINFHYGLPKCRKKYEYLFICRSGAWTPSWCDDKWLEFISYWKNRKFTDYYSLPYVEKEREFDIGNSIEYKKAMEEARNGETVVIN
jgi:hypothetical protein